MILFNIQDSVTIERLLLLLASQERYVKKPNREIRKGNTKTLRRKIIPAPHQNIKGLEQFFNQRR